MHNNYNTGGRSSEGIYFDAEGPTLIRNPLDPATGEEFSSSEYALFPGMSLASSEPGLVVLLYDSIRHQHPDTAMFLYYGREGSDPLLNRKWSERLLARWRNLGKPKLIVALPEDRKFLRGVVPEIPLISLYDELIACNVSGGCSRELYCVLEPDASVYGDAVRELAENMGAVICDETGQKAPSSGSDPEIPIITSSIDLRNSLKKKGCEAVHILELIYGMGASNTHLSHDHGDHDHDSRPTIRDNKMGPEEEIALDDLFSPKAKAKNLRELKETLLSLFWNDAT